MDGKISIVLTLLAILLAQQVKAGRILPNPFDPAYYGFYVLKGEQIITTTHKPVQNISFESYFSYSYGISYTIFNDNNNEDLGHAIIADNLKTGKIYIIRNPKEVEHATTDCELDNVHHHNHVFPWLYNVRYPQYKKNGSIYGPIAIWMNAINSSRSTDSQYLDFDVWTMTNSEGTKVEVAFAEQSAQPSWFRVLQIHKAQNDPKQGVIDHFDQSDRYTIKSFDKIDATSLGTESTIKTLNLMQKQLFLCRKKKIKHRVFPDLAYYLTNSPQKMFYIRYERQTFPLYELENSYDSSDPDSNRHPSKSETVVEVLSLKREAQSVDYRTRSDTEIKRNTYLKFFTGNKEAFGLQMSPTGAWFGNSTTKYYHLFETKQNSGNGEPFSGCFEGGREPSNKHKIFTRPVHFNRYILGKDRQVTLIGHLSGLIALLSNAAHKHYTEFRLDTKMMSRTSNGQVIYADEWVVQDENSSWDIHFYFRQLSDEDLQQHPNQTPIDRLLTIDIRDAKVKPDTKGADGQHTGYNLLMRFFIIKTNWKFAETVIQDMFKVPDMCVPADNQDDATDDDEEESETSDDDLLNDDSSDGGSDYISDDSSDEEGEDEHKEITGEGFELDHGIISEFSRRLPKPWWLNSDIRSFEVVFEIKMIRVNNTSEPQTIFLSELHIPEDDSLTISIYQSANLVEERKPHITYYFRYKSDALFVVRLSGTAHEYCQYVDDVDEPWLRLLSTLKSYEIDLPDHIRGKDIERAFINSDRMRRYGPGAIWQYASSIGAGETEFHGKGNRTIKIGVGSEYLPVHWSLNEMDFSMDFKFLYNVTKHKEYKSQGKHPLSGDVILHFDSLYIKGHQSAGTGFSPVEIKVQKNYIDHLDRTSVTLPKSCKSSMSVADQKLERRYKPLLTVPRFDHFAGREHSYYADYLVETHNGSSERIIEMFGQDGRGKIRIGSKKNPEILQIFIERDRNHVFEYSSATNECALKTMDQTHLDLVPGIDCDTDRFNPNKLFGLGALWVKLTEGPIELEVHPFGDRLFIVYATNTHSDQDSIENRMGFTAKKGLSELNELALRYILSSPSAGTSSDQDTTTTIHINKFDRNVVYKGSALPHSCVELIKEKEPTLAPEQESTSTTPPSDKAKYAREHFPRPTSLLGDKFLMRSEVGINYRQDEQSSVITYLLEEWYDHAGGVRLKSYDLKGQNMDLLIYPETDEYFDLSTPYKCENHRLPVLTGVSEIESRDVSEPKLAKFWSDDKTNVDHLSDLYYGALGLWRLAEKNLDHVELQKSSPVAWTAPPNDNSVLFMGIELWNVSIPGNDWSYLLHIGKFADRNITWSVLEAIDVTERSRKISIEVVNYRYDYQLTDLTQQFALPIGHGCDRSPAAVDKVSPVEDVFELDSAFVLWYDASLEIVKQGEPLESSAHQLLPTYSGRVIIVGRIGARHFDVVGQMSYMNYAQEATSKEFRKTVTTRSSSAKYDIDLSAGSCRLEHLDYSSHSQVTPFVLEFPNEDGHGVYSIQVPINARDKFWFNERVNRITDRVVYGGYDCHIYEQSLDYLELSKELRGRAAVMRFFYADANMNVVRSIDGRSIRKHDGMHTRVMLFDDETGSKLKAILNLSLYRLPSSTTDLLKLVSVAECFDDRQTYRNMGSYKISYPQVEADNLADVFYEKLIDTFYIDLDQLDGKAQVSVNRQEEATEIHFNLWEPSSLRSFTVYKEAKMHEQVEYAADSFPKANFESCFQLCQRFDCVAMSYCEKDQICKLITRDSMDREAGRIMYEISQAQPNQGCLYFYRRVLDRLPLTLGNFSYILDQYVNSVRSSDQLDTLSLRIEDDNSIKPIKFEDMTEYTDDRPIAGLQIEEATYGEQEDNYKLDLQKVEQLNKDKGTNFLVYETEAAFIQECVIECHKNDCIYLSHCKRGRTCTMIKNGSDIHLLRTGARVGANKAEACAVMVKEFHHNYDLYNDTLAPPVSTKRLDDYTAAECAFACESDGDKCRSFDYCKFVGQATVKDTCLLQADHIAMENIQRDILGPSLQDDVNQIDDKDVYCQHYSKSLLADFDQIPDRKFRGHRWDQTTRGQSARQCAAICIQDECEAFEYCRYPDERQSGTMMQSCRFLRTDATIDTIENSHVCSIYNRKQSSKDESFEHTLQPDSLIDQKVDDEKLGAINYYWVYPIYLFVAVVVGSLVQIVYAKIRGQSLLFH